MQTLIAIPVFNEEKYVRQVLDRVLARGHDILVIDDGSTDGTPEILDGLRDARIRVIRHPTNLGYGRSLRDAFDAAEMGGYDWVITMDCDEQHEPDAIPDFVRAAQAGNADIVSGSRYLVEMPEDDAPPRDRRAVNATITREINDRLGSRFVEVGGALLTDAFCGFKAHRVSAMEQLDLTEDGYAFPMQFWVQAAAAKLRVVEIPTKLIYNDPNRSFGGELDQSDVRLAYYRRVLHCELIRCAARLPEAALVEADCPCPGA